MSKNRITWWSWYTINKSPVFSIMYIIIIYQYDKDEKQQYNDHC